VLRGEAALEGKRMLERIVAMLTRMTRGNGEIKEEAVEYECEYECEYDERRRGEAASVILVVRHPIVLALVLSPKGGTRTRKRIDMFDHERRDVYRVGLEFVAWAYGHRRCPEGADRHARDQLLRASRSIPLNTDHLTDRAYGVRVLVAPPGLVDPWLPVNPWLAPWATVLAPLRGLV
jgi:hypothetical protein